MITKLDTTAGKKQIQQRFHPPAIFEHSAAHTNERPQKGASILKTENSSVYPGPIFSGMYEYNPPDFVDDEPPVFKPIIYLAFSFRHLLLCAESESNFEKCVSYKKFEKRPKIHQITIFAIEIFRTLL